MQLSRLIDRPIPPIVPSPLYASTTTASQSSTPTESIGRSPSRSIKSRQYDL